MFEETLNNANTNSGEASAPQSAAAAPVSQSYQLPPELPSTPEPKKRKRWPLLASLIVVVLGLAGGGVWAYTYYFPTPDVVLGRAFKNLAAVQSESFDGSITLQYQPAQGQASNELIEIPNNITIDLNGQVNSKDINNPEMNLSIGLSSSDIPLGRVEGDLTVADKIFYLRLRRFPEIPFFDLSPIKNQWIRFDTKDLPEGEDIWKDDLSADQKTRLNALSTQYPVAQFVKTLPEEDINGDKNYHYQLSLNKENFKKIVTEATKIYAENGGENAALTADEEKMISETLDKIQFTNWEIWINKKTFYPSKNLLVMNYTDDNGSLTSTVTMSAGRHNENIDIVTPEPSMTIEEAMGKFQEQFNLQASSSTSTMLNSDEAPLLPSGYENMNSSSKAIDTDADGLTDTMENVIGTNPRVADTDGDGYSDGDEVQSGYNPLGPGKSSGL